MNKKLNLVWMLVDSIRTYRTEQDLRGKLPVMERFGRNSVEFTTCVTTAPSTIMSITAMMTGLPAYFLARNYDSFRFDPTVYRGLSPILKNNGYSSYAFLRGPEAREKFANLLDPVPRRFWGDLKHGKKWTNSDLNRVLERLLASSLGQPAFFFFHYNPQTRSERRDLLIDAEVSDRVEWALGHLAEAGFGADNSVIVLCSDHGFPDPSTGLTSEWEAKHRLSHDLVLTDDNILVPLYIRYPGCRPRQITAPVSSLDIFPTLLDLLHVPEAEEIKAGTDGVSLVPLMESGDPKEYPVAHFRSDSRLMFQTARSTAIRSNKYKYIRYHDAIRFMASGEQSDSAEVLLDLTADPAEERNLLAHPPLSAEARKTLDELQAEFERTEQRAVEHQVSYLLARQGRTLAQIGRKVEKGLLVFDPATAAHEEISLQAVRRIYPDARVDVLTSAARSRENMPAGVHETFCYPEGDDGSPADLGNGNAVDYDLVIVFLNDVAATPAEQLLRFANSIPAAARIVLDCNFNVYRRERYWYYRTRTLARSLSYAVREPAFVIARMQKGVMVLARQALKKVHLWERWGAALQPKPPREDDVD